LRKEGLIFKILFHFINLRIVFRENMFLISNSFEKNYGSLIRIKINKVYLRFPRKMKGKISGYDNENLHMPNKIIEMGLLPDTSFVILHQAPFKGPLYIEYGEEKTRVALEEEEEDLISEKPKK